MSSTITGHICLVEDSIFKSKVLSELHSSPIVGHYVFHKTYERIKKSFFWEGTKKDIHTFVAQFSMAQGGNYRSSKSITTLTHSCQCVG
jgi:hypothetical protein